MINMFCAPFWTDLVKRKTPQRATKSLERQRIEEWDREFITGCLGITLKDGKDD